MDALSEDQEFFRDTVRKFLESEVPIDTVRKWADEPAGFSRDWWQRGAELGWTSMLVPEEHGGAALDGEGLLDLVIVAEEMGRMVSPGPLLATNVVAAAIAELGNPEQQARWIPPIVAGETIASWALTEPGGRWQPGQLELEAVRADGGWRLRGTKSPVEFGAHVDQLLVSARTGDGPVHVLVPADSEGIQRQPLQALDLVRRHAEVRFDDVFVPDSAQLGPVGAGDAERLIQIAIAIQLAESVGAVDRAFEFTLEWMFDRFSFGRPLASYQALKHRFADMKLWHEAGQAAASAAARAVQHRAPDAHLATSAAKAYVGDRAPFIVQECVQMHGGLGITWECDVHLYLRRVTSNRVLYGTPSEHRARIAQRLLSEETR